MTAHIIFDGLLVFATFTTLLVTGLLFTFALLVMPGLGCMDDREFLRGFQKIDDIIQRSHPLFVTVWVGSIFSLLIAIALGYGQLDRVAYGLLLTASLLYILGVQLPTFRGNVPLNNHLQTLDLLGMSEPDLAEVRQSFEPVWNRLNLVRTSIAMVVSILLIVVAILR